MTELSRLDDGPAPKRLLLRVRRPVAQSIIRHCWNPVAEHPHPVRSGKQPKILFATQVSSAPPTFVLFTSGKLEASYLRFVERRLREDFGFVGSPLHLQQRPRGRDQRR